MLHIQRMAVGVCRANCYILSLDGRQDAVVIDPGGDGPAIVRALQGRRVAAVLLTHGHFDHTQALSDVVRPDTAICIGAADAPMLLDARLSSADLVGDSAARPAATRLLRDGDALDYAGISFTVIATPGHTPGGMCYRTGELLFTGDTLFAHGYGRTDLWGGSFETIRESLRRLLTLGEPLRVLPGHDEETNLRRVSILP